MKEAAQYSALDIAAEICKISGYTLTHLKIQKLLYIIQVNSMKDSTELILEDFVAWKYGPVIEDVYHEYKKHGNREVGGIGTLLCKPKSDVLISDDVKQDLLIPTTKFGMRKTANYLVSLCHIDGGAWDLATNKRLGNIISKSAIRQEYDTIWKPVLEG